MRGWKILAAAVAPLRARHGPLPVLMCGMIGSRQGWAEAPYCRLPAGLAELAGSLHAMPGGRQRIAIVAGVASLPADAAPDVMRGEETQVLGALAAMRLSDGLFVLPGTHSKWVTVVDGRITAFKTYMTGEVFAAMKDHTILGRLMADGGTGGEGFVAGEAVRRT